MRIISHKEHKELKEIFIFGDGRGGGFRRVLSKVFGGEMVWQIT